MSEAIAEAIRKHGITSDGTPTLPIKVNYRSYKIVYLTEAQTERESIFGDCCKSKAVIRNYFDGTKRSANTMLHEILHAIYWEYDMHDEDKEERTVNTFANGLSAVIADNPEWFTWIQKELTK